MRKAFIFAWITLIAPLISAKITIVAHDEKFENCAKPEEAADFYSVKDLEIVFESDTDIFMNGTVKFFKDIDSPWMERHFLEHFDRGQWHIGMMNTQFQDWCPRITNPLEPWHKQIQHVQPCPISAGMEWKFDMVPADLTMPPTIPRHYVGLWRATFISEFEVDGVKKINCDRIQFDLVEV